MTPYHRRSRAQNSIEKIAKNRPRERPRTYHHIGTSSLSSDLRHTIFSSCLYEARITPQGFFIAANRTSPCSRDTHTMSEASVAIAKANEFKAYVIGMKTWRRSINISCCLSMMLCDEREGPYRGVILVLWDIYLERTPFGQNSGNIVNLPSIIID